MQSEECMWIVYQLKVFTSFTNLFILTFAICSDFFRIVEVPHFVHSCHYYLFYRCIVLFLCVFFFNTYTFSFGTCTVMLMAEYLHKKCLHNLPSLYTLCCCCCSSSLCSALLLCFAPIKRAGQLVFIWTDLSM